MGGPTSTTGNAGTRRDVASAPQPAAGTANGHMNAPQSAVSSLLLIDCGAAFTKVALVGVVDDTHRLLAAAQVPTNSDGAAPSLLDGVLRGIARLERTTGRSLASGRTVTTPRQPDGAGVDAIVCVISAGGPLCVLVGGPGRDTAANLIHRALGGQFIEAVPLPSASATMRATDGEWQEMASHVRALDPRAFLIIGSSLEQARQAEGIPECARALARWLGVLTTSQPSEDDSRQPRALPVVFAGPEADAQALRAQLATAPTRVQAIDELAPASVSTLSRAGRGLYEALQLVRVPGYQELHALTTTPPIAASAALGGVVRFLAQHYQMTVLGTDVGALSTAVVAATAGGEFLPAQQPRMGVGAGAGAIARATSPEMISRWLSWPASAAEVRDYVLSRMLHPHALATSAHELELEHALAREAIALTIHGAGSRLAGADHLDVLLGTGGVLAHAPHPALAALLLLDAIQPAGITSLVIDSAHIAPMIGAAAPISADIAAALATNDAVPLTLGSVISCAGTLPATEPAVRVILELADGRRLVEDVRSGTIARMSLAPGEQAMLSLYPAPTVDIGLGPGQHARASDPVEGGALGLVVDARGRPISFAASPEEQALRVASWRRALLAGE